MKFYQTQKFKKLQKQWDEKLKAAGFVDAEKQIGDEKELKQDSNYVRRNGNLNTLESKTLYYQLVGEGFNNETFSDLTCAWIMLGVASGRRMTDIHAGLLGFRCKIEYETVRHIVRRYEHKWKIKKYPPEYYY